MVFSLEDKEDKKKNSALVKQKQKEFKEEHVFISMEEALLVELKDKFCR